MQKEALYNQLKANAKKESERRSTRMVRHAWWCNPSVRDTYVASPIVSVSYHPKDKKVRYRSSGCVIWIRVCVWFNMSMGGWMMGVNQMHNRISRLSNPMMLFIEIDIRTWPLWIWCSTRWENLTNPGIYIHRWHAWCTKQHRHLDTYPSTLCVHCFPCFHSASTYVHTN